MVRDSFDELEVWSLNKSTEGKKTASTGKYMLKSRSLPWVSLQEWSHMSTQKERPLSGSCQTFYFFPLHLIRRLEEDQPCQIKNGGVGLACTGQGCPNQGLLGLLGNCRFVEISLDMLADNSESHADVSNKQAILWAWEQDI